MLYVANGCKWEPEIDEFIRWSERYDLYSYRGYDAAVLFGSAMFDDINGFFDDETFTPLQTPYRFTRTADGNRVNTEWVRVVYNDNYTITLE